MDIESSANLEADEAAVVSFVLQNQGRIYRDLGEAGTYWLELRPRSQPEERFFLRVGWTVYPHKAASVRFRDRIGGSTCVNAAWPVIAGYRPGSDDICRPFTAEGFETHKEWATEHPWPAEGNPFLWVVECLQSDLDTKYQGRAT